MNPEWHANAGWILAAILFLLQLVWFASYIWYQVKQHRKALEGLGGQTVDKALDGLGKRVDRHESEAEERYRALCFALLVLCPEQQKREAIAQLLQKSKWP